MATFIRIINSENISVIINEDKKIITILNNAIEVQISDIDVFKNISKIETIKDKILYLIDLLNKGLYL